MSESDARWRGARTCAREKVSSSVVFASRAILSSPDVLLSPLDERNSVSKRIL